MIAVGVPAYKINSTNGTREYTGLLGVASTDVPVDDIDKLTLPYKVISNFLLLLKTQKTSMLLICLVQKVGRERISIYC